jgi:hypothetical protein
VIENWWMVPILLNLISHEGGGFDNLIAMLMTFVTTLGGLYERDLVAKLFFFGENSSFQGLKIG